MWKVFETNKPHESGAYYCYGAINKKTKFEKYSRFVAYWDNDCQKWSDKDGEDLIYINDSVEYWFDINLVKTPDFSNFDYDKYEFETLIVPVMEYLANNYNPHTKLIIEDSHAELLEGQKSFKK
jgi:hypothetical protein